MLYAGTASIFTPATSSRSPGLTGLTFPDSCFATSAGATMTVLSFFTRAMSSGTKWSPCACVMRMRSAGGRPSVRPHESMYTTSFSPFQPKVDCLYHVNASSTSHPPLDRITQDADALDLHLHRIADLEVLGRGPREPHAGRRAGDDHVSRPELAARRDLGDETRDLEHHELRPRVLLGHAVHARADSEIARVELVGG